MRVAIVGAGLAGLATAAALSRSGHGVTVVEQGDGLRASGLAINLWSNATSLLPAFGIPASRIPGEPFSRLLPRASGAKPRPSGCQRGDLRTSPSSAPSCSLPWLPPCRKTLSAMASGAPMRANSPAITIWSSSRTVLARLCARPWPAVRAGDGRRPSGKPASPPTFRRCLSARARP